MPLLGAKSWKVAETLGLEPSYVDFAKGVMAKNEAGKLAMTVVTLRPRVRFSGVKIPTTEEIGEIHHQAHDECFIANSVKTSVRCEPIYAEDS